MEVVVKTKEELEKAVNEKVDTIIVEGELAKQVVNSRKAKKIGGTSLLLIAGGIAGIALIPVTGGLSAISSSCFFANAAVAGAGAVAGTGAGALVTSTAIATLGLVLLTAMSKDYDLEIENPVVGRIKLTRNKKD